MEGRYGVSVIERCPQHSSKSTARWVRGSFERTCISLTRSKSRPYGGMGMSSSAGAIETISFVESSMTTVSRMMP